MDIKGRKATVLIRNGNLKALSDLLQREPSIFKFRCLSSNNRFGWTMLHIAAEFGQEEITRFLLDKGMDPFATDILGRTPLHVAANKSHRNIAQILMSAMGPVTGENAPQDASGTYPCSILRIGLSYPK